jgi:ferritin heavy chain
VSGKEFFNNIEFVDMKKGCVEQTEDQIKKEITASLKYLTYGAYFSQDNVNRPGYAKFFFDAASEEREHAHKLIEYLQMRGRYFDLQDTVISNINIGQLVKESEKATALGLDHSWLTSPKPRENGVSAGMEAFRTALKMEYAVTDSIRNLISACEAEKVDGKRDEVFNDYHVSSNLFIFVKFCRP